MDKLKEVFQSNLKFNIVVLVLSIVMIVIFTGLTGYNKFRNDGEDFLKDNSGLFETEGGKRNAENSENYDNSEFSNLFTDSIHGNTKNFIHSYSKTFFLKALIAMYGFGLTNPVSGPQLSKMSRGVFKTAGINDESQLFAMASKLFDKGFNPGE